MICRSRTLAVGALATIALSACGALPAGPSELPSTWAPSASPEPLPSEDVASDFGFTRAQEASARVRNHACDGYGTGSAFAIDEHTFVTNRHVVENQYDLELTAYDGRDLTVVSSQIAPSVDLALITVAESVDVTLSLATTGVAKGTSLTIVGYPEGGEMTTTKGSVIDIVDDVIENEGQVFQTDVLIKHGSSGSPTINGEGDVIGIAYAGDDLNYSYIIPVARLQELLGDRSLLRDNPVACDL